VIRDQAVSRPNAPAICSASVYLTYKELDQLSSRFAAYIATSGTGPNSIVPILCDKVSKHLTSLPTLVQDDLEELSHKHPVTRH
jgi:non-ribosomal peptide synthetase component F